MNNKDFVRFQLDPKYKDLYHSMIVTNRAAYIGTGVRSSEANQYAIEVAQEMMVSLGYATPDNE